MFIEPLLLDTECLTLFLRNKFEPFYGNELVADEAEHPAKHGAAPDHQRFLDCRHGRIAPDPHRKNQTAQQAVKPA